MFLCYIIIKNLISVTPKNRFQSLIKSFLTSKQLNETPWPEFTKVVSKIHGLKPWFMQISCVNYA